MKDQIQLSGCFLCVVLGSAAALTSSAALFTTDTFIGNSDTNFDGLDITVTNATVTVEGNHPFASIHLLNGGRLTHSVYGNGISTNRINISNELLVMSSSNRVALSNSNVVVNTIVVRDLSGVTFVLGTDYILSILGDSILLSLLPGSAIAEGATVSVNYDALLPSGLQLRINNNLEVEAGGFIDANSRGFVYGPGAGSSSSAPFGVFVGGGGGHGGVGGPSIYNHETSGRAYGSLTSPFELGSGGGQGMGSGGEGGGAINLQIGGLLRVDGTISANGAAGTNLYSGGGSGGGIKISAQTFSGTGSISANGGAGEAPAGGGGGGGRIAIYYQSNSFSGSLSAHGGASKTNGGAGTIFLSELKGDRVLIENVGIRGAVTPLILSNTFDLRLNRGAVVFLQATNETISSLIIGSNSWIITGLTTPLALTSSGDVTIESGGVINADGAGYTGGQGPGAGLFFGGGGGGGGYGGYGGASVGKGGGGNYYGSTTQPADLGSGGGAGSPSFGRGGSGGGAIQLTVKGTLTLDGQITANGMKGASPGSGGGSGGSVFLTMGNFQGKGSISANGGSGEIPPGGGGGGGRIAVYSAGTNHFSGTLSARGGPGAYNGSAGTIYSKAASNIYAQFSVDNGGLDATNTQLTLGTNLDLVIGGGAKLSYSIASKLSLQNLLIRSNSFLVVYHTNNVMTALSVSGDATVEMGAGILLDGHGYLPNQGQGAGRGLSGGGGGYGGYGANGVTNTGGGNVYGAFATPGNVGSGGGTSTSSTLAGQGGGALQMTVGGKLSLYGAITADGGSALAPGCGGGSGGSLWLSAVQLLGRGKISANGGAGGLATGGGGGGGRVAIYSTNNSFTGTASAHGGAGASYGGAGTIYFGPSAASGGYLLVDNGGSRGTNTPVTGAQNFLANVVITNGATVISTSLGSPTNLFIATDSTLITSNSIEGFSLFGLRRLVIQTGGSLLLDGSGYPQNMGFGAGQFVLSGSGAGYGGYGGNGISARGGNTYGSIIQPNQPGSGGGGNGDNSGGAGGGVLRLAINGEFNGELIVDGTINANGRSGSGKGGGGSGGTISISANKISGSGTISADGGSSASSGGGGGGGRIVFSFQTNNFVGTLSAKGGRGSNNGGAGTIYLVSRQGAQQLIVDNGGNPGTNTVVAAGGNLNLTISGGATVSSARLGPLANLLIAPNSTLLLSNLGSLGLTVSSNVVIEPGAALLADGMGFVGGPGRGSNSGGAGYGGYGADGSQSKGGNSYGSMVTPTDLGSGIDGPGTLNLFGGGALQLKVGGKLLVDGRLTANGQTGPAGGASGGSLWLTVGSLAGSGRISANGGDGNLFSGGGGGGGRIAIYYGSNSFSGVITAYGGAGLNYGGAGTIYLSKTNGGFPQAILDNGGRQGTNTTVSHSQYDLTVSGGAVLNAPLTPAASLSVRNLMIASNSWITSPNYSLQLNVTGNADVMPGGGLTMNGGGNQIGSNQGLGGAANSTGGGGGYGGYGGVSIANAPGGGSHGSILQPIDQGGGGASSQTTPAFGGGAIKLNVSGNLILSGMLSANGNDAAYAGGGGGSGGSIWLNVGNLSGSGVISANGGSGDFPQGGGGGGGRIAIYSSSNQFAGPVTAYGGAGFVYGGAGTIYVRDNKQKVGTVLIDNGGIPGTNTALSSPEAFSVKVVGGAVVNPSESSLVLGGLLVDSGGEMTHLNSQSNLDVLVLGNALIETNGIIIVDGKGYQGIDGGPGAGSATNYLGSGGGYGGAGGASVSGAPGGIRYGSATHPMDRGSRGGLNPVIPNFCQGGGAVLFRVSSNLTVNGWISANGNSAAFDGGGGGAGGSIWLTARQIDGFGFITANGGQGEESGGGGGGGGRIAINSRTNKFTGGIFASGGPGANAGQNGTIDIASIPPPQIISQIPSDLIYSVVSNVDLAFDSAMNFTTLDIGDLTFETPNGSIPQSGLQVSSSGLVNLRLTFSPQSAIGYYELQAGPQIEDIYGQQMSSPYIGSFVILPPSISGQVLDSTGSPAAFVTLYPTGLPPEVADSHGNYSIEVPFGWAGTITPARGTAIFIPASHSYTNVSSSLPNQNFLFASPSSLTLSAQKQGQNFYLTWYGLKGVSYQVLSSTDLVHWTEYGSVQIGMNAPLTQLLYTAVNPAMFFRFQTSY